MTSSWRSLFAVMAFGGGLSVAAQIPEIPPELPQKTDTALRVENGLPKAILVTATVQGWPSTKWLPPAN